MHSALGKRGFEVVSKLAIPIEDSEMFSHVGTADGQSQKVIGCVGCLGCKSKTRI